MGSIEYVLPQSRQRLSDEAIWTPERSLSFAELEERSRRFARGLAAERVGRTGSFGMLARNRFEWPEIVLGNVRNGSRYVPLNWHLTAREIAELLVDSGATLLLVGPEDEAIGREAAAAAGIDRVIALGPGYENWLSTHPDDPTEDGPAGAPLLYTGGTTGRSKGVLRSDQGRPVSTLGSAPGWSQVAGMPTSGEALLTTPAYHALGAALLQQSLLSGHSLSILPRFDPIETLRTITDRGVTTTVMVPTQFVRLLKLDDDERERHDVSSVEWVLHTAAPCPAWAKRAMIEWFGPVIVELYGSSEGTGPVICTSEEWLERPGTVGRAKGGLVLSIVDEEGNDLPPGEVGTVYVWRPDGTPSYHAAPEQTAEMQLPDGRFTVGDIGWLDDDGFLFLADRRVDLILRGGVNIYPAEIEGVISQHESVADVAVFGIPDDDLGQSVKAVVELVEGATFDPEAIRAFAAERLAAFKLPSSIDVVDELPREAHGKLKKRLLRDPYWSTT